MLRTLKMTEEIKFSEPLYVLLGALLSAVVGGLAYLCKNQCRSQSCDCFSPCCKFHSDSRLRETIRQEIEQEKKRSAIVLLVFVK